MAYLCTAIPTTLLRSEAIVAVVQVADFRSRHDAAGRGIWTGRGNGLSFPSARCVRERMQYATQPASTRGKPSSFTTIT